MSTPAAIPLRSFLCTFDCGNFVIDVQVKAATPKLAEPEAVSQANANSERLGACDDLIGPYVFAGIRIKPIVFTSKMLVEVQEIK